MNTSNSLTVYGIPNCSSVKKGREWLAQQGIDYVFHDVKKQGVPAAVIQHWLKLQPWDVLVNRKGTTWRQLDAATQAGVVDNDSAQALMQQYPSVIKRPVFVKGDQVIVGVNPEAWSHVK